MPGMIAVSFLAAESGSLLTSIDQVIIFFYLGAVLCLGLFLGRFVKSSKDFFLAGKSLPFWAVGMSIVVSDIGAIDMVSGAGAAYKEGLAQANFDWLGSVPAMIIAAFVFVPFYWRSGVCTLPEFLGRRYGTLVRACQGLLWLGFLVAMLGVMLWTSAVFLNTVMGWSHGMAIWVTVVVAGVYTMIGGLTAVVLTDVIQTAIMFIGAAALLILSYLKIGGWNAMVQTVTERGPEMAHHFQLLIPNDADTSYPWSGILFGLGMVMSVAYFSGNQAVIQRVLGARTEWDAKASLLFAAFLKLLVPIVIILPGLVALGLHPDLEMADQAVPTLVRELLPPGLRGLVFAAFLAALMSSVDSYLNSATTIMISDGFQPLYQKFRGVPARDQLVLILGRSLTIILIVSAGFIAPQIENFKNIYEFIQTMFSMFQGPTLAILAMGLFFKRINGHGALAGLVSGVLFAYALNAVGDQLFPARDPFLFVSFWSFVFAVVATSAVSLVTPKPPEERLKGLVYRYAVERQGS